jgi:DNA-binding LytR/AlgR family response regulator
METFINVGGRTKLLSKDVAYFEADVNYTIIHYAVGNTKMVATTIGHIQDRLGEESGFIRPNRSFLINLDYIDSLRLGKLFLQNDMKVSIARRKVVYLTPIVEDHFEQKNLSLAFALIGKKKNEDF